MGAYLMWHLRLQMSLQIKGFTASTKPGQAHIHLFMPSDCCHQSDPYKLPPPTSSSIGNLLMHAADQFSDVARQLISLRLAPARWLSSLIHTNKHINTPLCKHTSHLGISRLIGGNDTVSYYVPTWATGGLRKVAWKRPHRLIMIWLVFMPSNRDAAAISGGSWRFQHGGSSRRTAAAHNAFAELLLLCFSCVWKYLGNGADTRHNWWPLVCDMENKYTNPLCYTVKKKKLQICLAELKILIE